MKAIKLHMACAIVACLAIGQGVAFAADDSSAKAIADGMTGVSSAANAAAVKGSAEVKQKSAMVKHRARHFAKKEHCPVKC